METKATKNGHGPVFSESELAFIRNHRNDNLILGLEPYGGSDYFEHGGIRYGYIHDILSLIYRETGLHIQIKDYSNWSDALKGIREGSVDILFGANPTEQRLEHLIFSEPIQSCPYAVFSRNYSEVQTLADFDGKSLAFIEGDIAVDEFGDKYDKINFRPLLYQNPIHALEDLNTGLIDGFVSQGGPVVNRFLHDYPNICLLTELQVIISHLTFSVEKNNSELLGIIEKVTSYYRDTEIARAMKQAEIDFNRRALQLSEEELLWLGTHPIIRVGVTENYLPFDYYSEGEYKGIAGSILTKACSLIGLKTEIIHGDFSDITAKARQGKIDVINMSKTDDRMDHFLFTTPFSLEQEVIYGRKDAPYVQDIYGLEGKRIAVIPSFWHYDSLKKNLLQPNFVEASSTEECIEFLHEGKADYFIQNRAVAEYYLSGLGYSSIMEKGISASDSYQYFAVRKDLPLLSSILQKSMLLISYEREKYNGLRSLPAVTPKKYRDMIALIIILSVFLIGFLIYIYHTLKALADQKANNRFLKERTKILYMDPLTGVKNRAKFYESLSSFDELPYPQAFVTIDINDLKKVNDNYGHHMGDHLIQSCVNIITSIYQSDFIFRMGGDEFLVVYFPKNPQEASEDIKKLHELCKLCMINCSDEEKDIFCPVSMAVGCVFRSSSEEPLEAVLKNSDNLMYQNKKIMKKNAPM